MNKNKIRESNLELYRIIVMLLIVAHHFVVNSGLTSVGGPIYNNPFAPKSLFLLLFGAWGKTGINCFVLITGYFMCKSQITLKKFIKLVLMVILYRVLFSVVFWVTSYDEFTIDSIAKAFLMFRSIDKGFTAAYLFFFLFIPFLNILINNLDEIKHIKLLCLALFIYVFYGTVPLYSVTMNYVSWFMVLYLVSSYIRLHPKKIFQKTKLWGCLTLGFIILAALSVVVCAYISKVTGTSLWYRFVQDSNTLLAVLIGISSFLFFKNIKIQPSPVINSISATCFGILQIHANSYVMRRWLWTDTLKVVESYNSSWMILYAVISVIVVFFLCSLIDMLRIRYIEVPFFRWFDKKYEKIKLWYNKKENSFKDKLLNNTDR